MDTRTWIAEGVLIYLEGGASKASGARRADMEGGASEASGARQADVEGEASEASGVTEEHYAL